MTLYRSNSSVFSGKTSARMSGTRLTDFVDAVCPAVEIIDDRRADYRALDALYALARLSSMHGEAKPGTLAYALY
jgi:hypothetical protein